MTRGRPAAHLVTGVPSRRPTQPSPPAGGAVTTVGCAPPEVVTLARFVHVLGLAVQGRHIDAERELARRRAGPDPAEAEEARAMSGILALLGRRRHGRAVGPDRGRAGRRTADVGAGADHGPRPPRGGAVPAGRLGRRRRERRARRARSSRDAGVLLGAGVANALASYVAAGRGDWDDGRGTRLDGGDWRRRAPALVGRPGARRDGPAVLAQARGDHAAMVEALQSYADPAVHDPVDRVGVLPWRALRVEALLGLGRIDEAAGRARRAGGAGGGAPAGLVGAGSGPAAVRDRRDRRARRRRCAAAYARRRRWRSRFPPSCPGPASRWRTPGTCSPRAIGVRPSTSCGPRMRGSNGWAPRRSSPSATSCCAPPGCTRRPRAGTFDLTPQELAVARLVAEGRTNQEAGAALFVTGRTVAFHLSNIYAKLGVSSRRELAARLNSATGRSAGRS